MYCVYILKVNHPEKEYYIGSTPNLKRRLEEHKSGCVQSTKGKLPVELIYYECYINDCLAKTREKNLKKSESTYMGLMKKLDLK